MRNVDIYHLDRGEESPKHSKSFLAGPTTFLCAYQKRSKIGQLEGPEIGLQIKIYH